MNSDMTQEAMERNVEQRLYAEATGTYRNALLIVYLSSLP